MEKENTKTKQTHTQNSLLLFCKHRSLIKQFYFCCWKDEMSVAQLKQLCGTRYVFCSDNSDIHTCFTDKENTPIAGGGGRGKQKPSVTLWYQIITAKTQPSNSVHTYTHENNSKKWTTQYILHWYLLFTLKFSQSFHVSKYASVF